MTLAASRPVLVDHARISASAGQRRRDPRPFFETTELRWFVPEPLPADVRGWLTGSTGVFEQRCDTYLLSSRDDIGLKRRFRETLELKVRQSLAGRIQFVEGFAGPLEVWRRWSPVEDLVVGGSVGRWVDVCKSIVKRRFLVDGTEIPFSSDEITGAGCDVEVAEVTVEAVGAWTFAFAAFGPLATREDALLSSFRQLKGARPYPESFRSRTGQAMGYPEWLALTVSPS